MQEDSILLRLAMVDCVRPLALLSKLQYEISRGKAGRSDPRLRVRPVHAHTDKPARAELLARLFETGRAASERSRRGGVV